MHTRLTLLVDCFRVDIEPRKLPTASLCKRNTNNHAVYKAVICNIRYLTILCVKQVTVDSRCTRLSYSVCWLVSSVSDRWTSLKVSRFVVVHEEKNQILIIMLSFTFCDAGILPPLLMLMLLLLLLYFVFRMYLCQRQYSAIRWLLDTTKRSWPCVFYYKPIRHK